jgi:4-amino-4-deoxy-L-arabinose transferase-like glycosyltransferase
MTKAIWVFIILIVAYVGYLLFQKWDEARLEQYNQSKLQPAAVTGESLQGMPYQLEPTLRAAKDKGSAAFQAWFTANERNLADPRKAWIELELCMALSRDNPAEAKKIYAAVKSRVPPSSPVFPKLKSLEKAFE